VWGVEEEFHAFAPVEEVVEPEVAGALLGPEAARRDEPAEPAPGGAVAGERGGGEAVAEDDAGGGNQAGRGADRGRGRGAVGDGLEPGDGLLPALRAARVVVEGAVGGPGGGQDRVFGEVRADRAVRLGLGAQLHLPGDLARMGMGADDAGDGILVGDGERGQAEERRTLHVFLGMGAPGEEGEVRGGVEFGEHGTGMIFAFCSRVESCLSSRRRRR
jgi:hypothetical protein